MKISKSGEAQSTTEDASPRFLAAVFVVQAVLLVLAGWHYRYALNPDGIAYMRIAGYYADGRTDLAVSGYWGPLISWLMVPWLKVGMAPLVAARLVMGISALVFVCGSLAVFRSFRLADNFVRLGLWLAAGLSVYWSVENITPDLFVAGLIGLACSGMFAEGWQENASDAIKAGLWWGLAFWAKAIAFPLALIVSGGIAVVWWTSHKSDLKKIARSLSLTLLIFAVVSGAWITVLSLKYGRFTLSASARLNHAMVGPPGAERPYPFGWNFQKPGPGRITVWEDPSTISYPDWSPWENAANARHQLQVSMGNVPVVLFLLTSIQVLLPLLLAFIGMRLLRSDYRKALTRQRWWWSALTPVMLGALYLPGNLLVTEQRYFYAAFPFLFVLSVGALFLWEPIQPASSRWRPYLIALAGSFILSGLLRLWMQPVSTRLTGECAHMLAEKMAKADIRGPIAGNGFVAGGRAGLCTAFFLNQPWYGDDAKPTPESYKASEAELIIVNRLQPITAELDHSPSFRNLDDRLFSSGEEAANFPLKVYRAVVP